MSIAYGVANGRKGKEFLWAAPGHQAHSLGPGKKRELEPIPALEQEQKCRHAKIVRSALKSSPAGRLA